MLNFILSYFRTKDKKVKKLSEEEKQVIAKKKRKNSICHKLTDQYLANREFNEKFFK